MSFIVVEGLDGAGTTTQAARLAAWLRERGHTAVETHEPTDGPVGRLIRAALRRQEGAVDVATLPWMFAADRADHLARLVEPSLASGSWVISDRYLHSSMAYQSLDIGMDAVFALNAAFRVPDLTLFIDVPVDTCLARIEARGGEREIFEERTRLERIDRAYRAVLSRLEARGDPIVSVDGSGSIDAVSRAVRGAVAGLVG